MNYSSLDIECAHWMADFSSVLAAGLQESL